MKELFVDEMPCADACILQDNWRGSYTDFQEHATDISIAAKIVL